MPQPQAVIFHTSIVEKKASIRSDEIGGTKNEHHRLSAKLADLRALQQMKLAELAMIEQSLYTRSSSVSFLESKLIDLERSQATLTSQSRDLLDDRVSLVVNCLCYCV